MRSGRIGKARFAALPPGRLEGAAVGGHFGLQCVVLETGWVEFFGDPVQHLQRLLQVRHGTDLHRVIAADFARVNVNMDQLGHQS
jgi:hypothetical protein